MLWQFPALRENAQMTQPLRITLRQLRAFSVAYKLRNLTHAAESLHMTQSAMSALIQQMEESLGVKLFERTPRMLRPTQAADEAYEQSTQILTRAAALQRDMAERTKVAQATLAFSCVPALTSGVVPTVIAEFEKEEPAARVVVYDEIDAALLERLLSGKAEFSISTFEHDPEFVWHSKLAESFFSVICHRDSALAQKEAVSWRDLLDQRVINLFRGEPIQQLISEIFPIDGRPFLPTFEVGYIQTALAMCAQRLGVIVLPDYFIAGNPHFTSLVAKKLHDPEMQQTLYVHIRKGHELTAIAQSFLDLLRRHLSSSHPSPP